MCFTQPISLFFTVLGFAASLTYRYFNYKVWKDPDFWRFTLCLDFFAFMEALQFVQYFWLDQCDSTINVILTWVGFLHICFQPFVFNLGCSWRLSKANRSLVDKLILPLCLVFGIIFATRGFLADSYPCPIGSDPLCAADTCTYSGSIHLAWRLKLRAPNLWTPGAFEHHFMMFAPGFFAGNMWSNMFFLMSGPVLAHYLTGWHHGEWASVWCFYSIFQTLSAICYGHLVLWKSKQAAKSRNYQGKQIDDAIASSEKEIIALKAEKVEWAKKWNVDLSKQVRNAKKTE